MKRTFEDMSSDEEVEEALVQALDREEKPLNQYTCFCSRVLASTSWSIVWHPFWKNLKQLVFGALLVIGVWFGLEYSIWSIAFWSIYFPNMTLAHPMGRVAAVTKTSVQGECALPCQDK